MLKVAHVIPKLHQAGAEVFLTGLLPRLAARGLDVEPVTFFDTNALASTLTRRGIRIETLGHRGGTIYRLDRWIPTAKNLHTYIRLHRPAIVHTHLYMADVVARLVGPRETILVTTLHSVDPWWEQPVRLRSRLKTYLDGCLARWRHVRLIAVSQDAASAAAGALAISPERIRVIRNGIDLELFPFNPRRAFPGSSSAPCLVQIGRLDDPKGHSVALAAFPRVLEAFPEARLLFVGDGPLRTRLESQTRALGLDGRVRFLGVRSDIPALLEASDLFWMPSRWEGLPIACLEAMACGLPTVTTDVVGLREVAVDGVTGFVAPPDSPELLAQASLRILKDPALAQRMGLAGRQRVEEKFSIERTADEYARAYEDIMQGRWK